MPPEADVLDPETIAPARRRIQQVKVRATPDVGEGTFEALVSSYAVTYEIGYFWQERILPGCFEESIAAHPVIPVCWNHQWGMGPIGHGEPTELNMGIIVRGELYLDLDPLVARLYRAMKAKAVEEWSIAFYAEEITWTADEPEVDQIVKGDLVEATACFRGANPDTGTIDLRDRAVIIDGDPQAVKNEIIRIRSVHGGKGPDPEKFRAETPRRRAPADDVAPEPTSEPTPEPAKPKADAAADPKPAKERLVGMREKLVQARADDAEIADLALVVDELIDELSDLVEEADGAVDDVLDAVGAGGEDPDDGDKAKEDAAAQEARLAASKAFLGSRAGLELLRAQRASASGPSSSQSEGHPSPEPKEPANA